jgi:hypothetical protein
MYGGGDGRTHMEPKEPQGLCSSVPWHRGKRRALVACTRRAEERSCETPHETSEQRPVTKDRARGRESCRRLSPYASPGHPTSSWLRPLPLPPIQAFPRTSASKDYRRRSRATIYKPDEVEYLTAGHPYQQSGRARAVQLNGSGAVHCTRSMQPRLYASPSARTDAFTRVGDPTILRYFALPVGIMRCSAPVPRNVLPEITLTGLTTAKVCSSRSAGRLEARTNVIRGNEGLHQVSPRSERQGNRSSGMRSALAHIKAQQTIPTFSSSSRSQAAPSQSHTTSCSAHHPSLLSPSRRLPTVSKSARTPQRFTRTCRRKSARPPAALRRARRSSLTPTGAGCTLPPATRTATPATPGTRTSALTQSLARRTARLMARTTAAPTASAPAVSRWPCLPLGQFADQPRS